MEAGFWVDKRERQRRKVRWEQLDEVLAYDGTDIKLLEIVFFMRSVASKNFFEQMKRRGMRVVSDTEMEQVKPGVRRKTRYLIIHAVGVTEPVQTKSRPLKKKPSVSFEKLLDVAALGTTEVAAVESLAGRLIRLERRPPQPPQENPEGGRPDHRVG